MEKNKMLEDVKVRYLALLNAGSPKGKKEKDKYAAKLSLLVTAAQCLVACGAVIEVGWPFEKQFDINTFWPNFMFNMEIRDQS